ncbi:MAG: thioredoxin family protein [Deltaproteobacteria bacterium]|nr:thioredoxin family protein [Deltaproteobacteria bacterium]
MRKNILATTGVGVAVLFCASGAAVAAPVPRPTIVKVTTKWCSSCHEFDAKVFSRPAVRALVDAKFKLVAVDAETAEGMKIVKRHNVVGYPTILFLNARDKEIDRYFTGPSDDPDLFVRFAEGVLRGEKAAALRVAKGAKEDLRARFARGEWHAMRGDEKKALAILRDVVKRDSKNEAGFAAQAYITLGKFFYVRGKKRFAEGAKVLERLRREFPVAKEAAQALFPLAYAYVRLGRENDAFKLLDDAIAAAPEKPGPYNTFAWFTLRTGLRRDEGVKRGEAGVARAPKDDGLWDTLAELYMAVERKGDAVRACEKARELQPATAYYREQCGRFERGELGFATPALRKGKVATPGW